MKFSKFDSSLLLANLIDHFDSSLYAFLVPFISPLFFPAYDTTVQWILGYSVLTTSLITRPVGAFIFGNLAKHYGARLALSYSLFGFTAIAVGMGTLPTYASIGIGAPILLFLLRMLEGIFTTGENTIAKLYILEDKEQKQMFVASLAYQFSTMCGIILASLSVNIILGFSHREFLWRYAYFFEACLVAIAFLLRQNFFVFQTKKISEAWISWKQIVASIYQKKIPFLRVAFISSFSYLTYALPFVFINSFVPLVSHVSIESMMKMNTLFLILDVLLIPIFGWLLKKYSAQSVMTMATLMLAIGTLPLFYYLNGASELYVLFARIFIVILGVMYVCFINILLLQQFTGNEKYLWTGLACAFGDALFGKSSPAICLLLWHQTHFWMAPALYVFILSILACVSILKNTNREK